MKTLCNKIGCNALVNQPERYCSKHKRVKKENRSEYDKKYDQEKRNKERKKFYNSRAWKIVRKKALTRDNYLCQECLKHSKIKNADVVHHIKPIETHWNLRLTLENLESLCHECHTTDHKRTSDKDSNKPESFMTRGVL